VGGEPQKEKYVRKIEIKFFKKDDVRAILFKWANFEGVAANNNTKMLERFPARSWDDRAAA